MSDGIDPQATAAEWPGWTYAEFERYLTDTLPPFIPIPGSITGGRSAFIDHAWLHPLSAQGAYVEMVFSVKEWAGDEAFLAAQRWGDAMTRKSGGPGWSILSGGIVAALVIPGTGQVSIQMESGGQQVVNVVGVDLGGGTIAEATANVKAAWEGAGGPLSRLQNTIAVKNYRGMDLSSAQGAIADVSSTALGGLSTGSKSTNAACALVKWNGGTRSRSSRGRLYYGPIAESEINTDGRTIASVSATAIQNVFSQFRQSLANAGTPLVVISRKNATATPITSHAVETIIATQRRRVR